jgi:hypothetical protein
MPVRRLFLGMLDFTNHIYTKYPHRIVVLLPVTGMFIFIVLYILAALAYTGGSYQIPSATYFDFWHNYLCDLLDKNTYNGTINSSRYYAQAALLFLCVSIMMVWFFIPALFSLKKINRLVIQTSGILSMVITLFLSSKSHDLIVRIAGVFGLIAMGTLIKELIKARYYRLAAGGFFCLLILMLNYAIYESGMYINALPVIQKLTFVSFMLWFGMLNIALYLHIEKMRLK